MSYEDYASEVVKIIESVGGAIMVIGGLFAFARFGQEVFTRASDPYRRLRANLGRVILLGLEVLIIADIIRTIVVDQSLESVGVLGLIVAVIISSLLILLIPSLPAQIPLWAILAGLGVSTAIGLIFGVWPARKAANLDPIESLRYE